MERMGRKLAVTTAMLLATASTVSFAQETSSDVRAELEQLRAEVAALKADKAQSDKSAAEIYMLAQEKAESAGGSAGITDKGKIYLKDANGNFTIGFKGQVQFRYIWNHIDGAPAAAPFGPASESTSGFQFRRMKFGAAGTVGDGWGYGFTFSTVRNSGAPGGNVFTEDAYISYKYDDNLTVVAGSIKLPFARQELISSSKQVAVDRGLSTEFFTLNRSDQVQFRYDTGDMIKVAAAISDGGNANFSGFGADASNDFAVTTRVDAKLMGDDWGAAKTESAGTDEDALFVGVAAHYQVNEGLGAPAVADHAFSWTADALFKTGDIALSAALFGNHVNNLGVVPNRSQYGLYLQGNYAISDDMDVFGRYEWIDDDGAAGPGVEQIQAITLGVNKHFSSNVKFTGDVVYIFAGDDPAAAGFVNGGELGGGIGLAGGGPVGPFSAGSGHDEQIAVRLQLQLLF